MLRSHFIKAVLIVLSVGCVAYAQEDNQKPRRVPTEDRGPAPEAPPPRDDGRSMGPGVVEERIPRPPREEPPPRYEPPREEPPTYRPEPRPPREEPNPYRPPREEPPTYRPEPPRRDDPPFRPPQPPRHEPPTYRPEPPRYEPPVYRPEPPRRPRPPIHRPRPPVYRPEPPVYQPPYNPPSQSYWQYETVTVYVGRAVANERFYLREAAALDGTYRGWEVVSVRAVTRSNSPRTTTVKLVSDGRTLVTQINPRNQINLVPTARAVLDSNINSLEMVILGSTIIVDNIEIQLRVYRN